jgi:hypothetical protein
MPIDETSINAVFFLSLGTLICSFSSLIVKYCYKSKCKSVKICCLKITRDIETELKEDLNEQNHNIRLDIDSPNTNHNK